MVSPKHGRLKRKDHAQDGGTLIAKSRSASGDPAMVFELRMASILSCRLRAPCPRPAAGLLLDVLCLSMILSENRYPVFSDRALAHDRSFGNRKPAFRGRSCQSARQ